ncbi:hypothetical protein Misp01_57290 [Microtetraspora sp. NBRC 13810]|uniref:DUF6506 family protein n=1 Tax=Microtetraspora sp. NBRC 13810 TaxID=3030990 RepID=UPI0024A1B297|nr:DUF6506 family protein [Microtetraspora sp. NBRC 13810]GLW10601.1 hypothetical protein Misp01_57290 [Microtetraspora sp. NBRC 13810]
MSRDSVIVYEEAGADPLADVMTIENGHGRTRVRAVAEPGQMVELVTRLVGEGVDRIELCGAFGAVWHAAARRATGGKVPVGAVYYGFESLTSVASYKARFEAGETLSEAFVIVHEGADPEADRVVRERDAGGRTTLIGVPDAEAAAEAAGKMAGELHLIELYGGEGPEGAEPVIRAVRESVPVGVTAYRR